MSSRFTARGFAATSLAAAAFCGCSALTSFGSLVGSSDVDAAQEEAVGADATTIDGSTAVSTSGDATAAIDARALDGTSNDADGGTTIDASFEASIANHAIKTVFVIVMTHFTYAGLMSSGDTPYLSSLVAQSAVASNYVPVLTVGVAEPNDLWLEAADNFGITDDNLPVANHQATTVHLTTELEAAGVTWKSYQEDIPANACPLTDVNQYLTHHNPFVYFDDITNGGSVNAARCLAHVRPYSELAADLAGTPAQYNFITPDRCHDMHDDCRFGDGGGDPVAQGDLWLSTAVPTILGSAAYKAGGLLLIIWDYPGGGTAHLPFLALSPFVKANTTSSTLYSHNSFVLTMTEIFGVAPFRGAAAAQVNDFRDLFTTFP